MLIERNYHLLDVEGAISIAKEISRSFIWNTRVDMIPKLYKDVSYGWIFTYSISTKHKESKDNTNSFIGIPFVFIDNIDYSFILFSMAHYPETLQLLQNIYKSSLLIWWYKHIKGEINKNLIFNYVELRGDNYHLICRTGQYKFKEEAFLYRPQGGCLIWRMIFRKLYMKKLKYIKAHGIW